MGRLKIDVTLALTLLAVVLTGPADVSADPLKTCIYPQGGNAPAVGPYPCRKEPHFVRIDRRAIFRPDPLSPYRERSNFGRETADVTAVATEPAALAEAEEPWVPEIEAP